MSNEPDSSQVLLDLDRKSRTGLAEAIFCKGKTQSQLRTICEQLGDNNNMLFTRLEQSQYDQLPNKARFNYDPLSKTAWIISEENSATTDTPSSLASVAILTGGSTDVGVSREAARTLQFYGINPTIIDDVGVAGLWRVMDRLDEIRQHKIIIAVAGMDAALPTVLGGLVGSCIIAVPTSVGYGMAKDGETALQALLVSCASGITVTNIDNGFGAACAAIRILNQFS